MMSVRWKRFAVMMLALVLSVSVAAAEKKWPIEGYWLPEAASTYAEKIDGLFNGILYLTGFVFVVTELLLLVFLIKYRRQEGRKSVYSHGNHTLEMVWTLIPALILAIIAFVQKGTWDEIKSRIPEGKDNIYVKNYGEQFQWNFRYAGADGKWGTKDDMFEMNNLVVPVNKNVVIEQTSKDVIHSFFLPYMRLKQDLVPGMYIKVWFNATKTTKDMQSRRNADWNYEIVCAELCGNQHSQMKGILKVLEPAEYDEWLKKRSKEFENEEVDVNMKLWSKWELNEDGTRKMPVAVKEEKKHDAH